MNPLTGCFTQFEISTFILTAFIMGFAVGWLIKAVMGK